MKALQDEFLANGGEYKNYKLEKLFTSENGDTDLQQKDLEQDGSIVVSSGVNNCGVIGYSNTKAKIIQANTITIDMFGNVFYRDYPYKMVTHARVFALTFKTRSLTRGIGIYIATQLFYLNQVYSYGNMASWNKVKDTKISLPTLANGELAFDFMSSLISELEEERISELEEERISELEAYLEVTGLSDTTLSDAEQQAAQRLASLKWEDFKISEVLTWQTNIKEINPMKLSELYDKKQGAYPFYGQATHNNGIISYEQLTRKVLNNKSGKPTILIHSNNQNIIYTGSPFYLKDGHGATSVLQMNKLNEILALYLITSIKKVISIKYSYATKATKIALKNTLITLPIKEDGSIDYDYMEVLIRAIQKQVIQKVITYKDEVIKETRNIVNSI